VLLYAPLLDVNQETKANVYQGQGANQAMEDGFSISLLMARMADLEGQSWLSWLQKWESMRQERVGKLVELTKQMNNSRLPPEAKALLKKEDIWSGEGGPEAMRWLFVPRIEEWVDNITKHLS
jgi:hypothetical protein